MGDLIGCTAGLDDMTCIMFCCLLFNVDTRSVCNLLSCPLLSAANVDLMCVHLGQGLTSNYPVLLRISQMFMTSKQHMNRCTTTWSARTRNCIPSSLPFSSHTCAYKLDAREVNMALVHVSWVHVCTMDAGW